MASRAGVTAGRSRRVWQVAGGPSNRDYSGVFLDHGVALIGPGDSGRWKAGRRDEDFEGPYTRQLAEDVATGDVFLLRTGRATIRAVGVVASEYKYLDQFSDVNGWDLQQARRVRWRALPEPYGFPHPVFGARPPRFSTVNQREVIAYVDQFLSSPPTGWQQAALPALPPVEDELDVAELPAAVQGAVAAIRDLVPLYKDEKAFGRFPEEHEVVAHCVVPLMRACGWAPELVAVEWHQTDVALFERLPREAKHVRLIVEVKRPGAGIEGAVAQAEGYRKKIGVPCDVVMTDGVRYVLYSGSPLDRVASLHVMRLRSSGLAVLDRLMRHPASEARR